LLFPIRQHPAALLAPAAGFKKTQGVRDRCGEKRATAENRFQHPAEIITFSLYFQYYYFQHLFPHFLRTSKCRNTAEKARRLILENKGTSP